MCAVTTIVSEYRLTLFTHYDYLGCLDLSVCVGYDREACKNSGVNQDAVQEADLCWPKEPRVRYWRHVANTIE